MKESSFELICNNALTADVFETVLKGDISDITSPGQFINIKLDGLFLRRPISVADLDEKEATVTIVYKTVGAGTEKLKELKTGSRLNILTGLGNGYDLSVCGGDPLLIGGGVGTPPMYYLCRRLIEEGKSPRVILGFNKKDEIFFEDRFAELGVPVTVTTVDGSYGVKGYVTDAMKKERGYSYIYACGPFAMMRGVADKAQTDGQFSLEERMGCGFGACMGCTVHTRSGDKRVCREGPVFEIKDIIF